MPYRIDLDLPPGHAIDTLIDLGALDVEPATGTVAALMPDAVAPSTIARALGVSELRVSPAIGRDDDSVWTLGPRPLRVGSLQILPSSMPPRKNALRLVDSVAFGTGMHATTALCLQAIDDVLNVTTPDRLLDVGTGSGVLALAALLRGVRWALGLDIDAQSLRVAAENARLNALGDRLSLVCGSADVVRGSWPLVVANIRAGELLSMQRAIVRRVAGGGHLVLSGIPQSAAAEVEQGYRRAGMTPIAVMDRDGWTALVLRPSW